MKKKYLEVRPTRVCLALRSFQISTYLLSKIKLYSLSAVLLSRFQISAGALKSNEQESAWRVK